MKALGQGDSLFSPPVDEDLGTANLEFPVCSPAEGTSSHWGGESGLV